MAIGASEVLAIEIAGVIVTRSVCGFRMGLLPLGKAEYGCVTSSIIWIKRFIQRLFNRFESITADIELRPGISVYSYERREH